MTNKEVLDQYCQVILHRGCALTQGVHKWEVCPIQDFYRRIARKHQNWLKSNGLAIGIWVDEDKFEIVSKGA